MEVDHLTVLYRGPLSSCNYGCPYCPFAKRVENAAEHRADAAALTRFVDWVGAQPLALSVLFTPWGEALVRPRYQEAVTRLSLMPNVRQVAIQTNLSGKLGWLAEADRTKVGLWATFHPGEVAPALFLAKCAELETLGVRYSVGVVGKREHFPDIQRMRRALPAPVYLWVNAYSQGPRKRQGYYSAQEFSFLQGIDPLFEVNTRHYPTRGLSCAAGETVISVDGDGTARRCHFIPHPLRVRSLPINRAGGAGFPRSGPGARRGGQAHFAAVHQVSGIQPGQSP